MRTQRVLLAAVCGVGIAGFGSSALAQDMAPMPPLQPTETSKADQQTADATAIKQILRETTNASFTKAGFDDLVERLAKTDRTRLAKDSFTEQKHETLDGRLAQIQKDWLAKYNQEFNLTSAGTVFGPAFAAITVQPSAVTAGERKAPTDDAASRADNTPAPERRGDAGDTTNYADATVVIAESHGMPEVRLNLQRENMGRWKIDVSDSYTARQLHDNLLKQLTIFNDQKSSWPDNADEAYRMASHRVFLAVTDMADKPGAVGPANPPIPDDAPFPPKPSETPAPKP